MQRQASLDDLLMHGENEPLLQRAGGDQSAEDAPEKLPEVSLGMISYTIQCSISCMLGYIFEYFQDVLNVVFIANMATSENRQLVDMQIAAIVLSSTVTNLFGFAVLKGLNDAILSLVPQTQGQDKNRLSWLYYAQGKVVMIIAAVPVVVLLAL